MIILIFNNFINYFSIFTSSQCTIILRFSTCNYYFTWFKY